MMRAYLTISGEVVSDSFTQDRVLEFIKDSGVQTGILEDAITEMVREQVFEKEVLIARGSEPISGEDGRVDYKFDPHPTLAPEVREDGSVDYMKVNILQKVVPGQVVACAIPPSEGKPGYDIQGKVLPAVPGRMASINRGKNTSFGDKDPNILKSDVQGHVKLAKDGTIEVVTVYEVKGDVNYTIGSIDFNGDVIVNGDVLSGFKVIATGEIEVKGVVEDAQIEAGRSVVVRGGFIGSGKGKIKAGVDVLLRYVHHQNVEAVRDIIIANESMNAHLTAGRSISVNGGAGVLVGGIATARTSIECKTIGNEAQTRTEVVIEFESEVEKRYQEQIKFVENVEMQFSKVDKTLKKMEEVDAGVGNVDPARQKLYGSLYSVQHELKESLQVLHVELKEITEKLNFLKSALFVKSTRCAFPGVNITIAGSTMQINQKVERQHFMLSKGSIIGLEMKHE